MTTSRINAYRWPARLVSHKPFAAERYFITSSSIWQVFFCRKLRFFFFIFSVLSTAAFSVQDAQSQRFLPVENSPAPLCSISMGGKGGGYTYYIGKLPPPKPVGFASSLWEGFTVPVAPPFSSTAPPVKMDYRSVRRRSGSPK